MNPSSNSSCLAAPGAWCDRMRRRWWAHRSMSPAVLFSAQMLLLYVARLRLETGFGAPFLAFVPMLESPAVAGVMPAIEGILFFGGVILTGLNLAPRVGAAAAGSALLLDILGSRQRFSNNGLLFGLLLVLMALQDRDDRNRWLLRGQLALVYGGAALNKLLHADWLSGRFLEFWSNDILQLEWYRGVQAAFPAGALSQGICWLTIAVECALAVLALLPRRTFLFVAAGIAFHIVMLVFTAGQISWVFLYLMTMALLALTHWSPYETAADAWREISRLAPRPGRS